MADNETKANDLMAQAEKKTKSSSGFLSNLFGGSSKTEEAAELYVRAANTYKMAKKWSLAGNAFCQGAILQIRLGSKHEAATHYVDAANCFKKSEALQAVDCLSKSIEIYTDMGRFTIAAKHHITIAEIYETEIVDIDQAITHYEQAADYYKGEESNSSANKCLLKVAQYCAQLEKYDRAIEIYEQVATSAMDNQLLRYSAKDHFFRATLCQMCRDFQDTSVALKRYAEQFPAFSDCREHKLVTALIAAIEDSNVDAFTDAVREYDTISRLDQWYTTMLLRIKKTIEGDGDLR